MTNCDYCGKIDKEFPKGYNRNFCNTCVSDKEIGFASVIEKVYIEQYGYVEKSRLEEMKRRVILPVEPDSKSGRSYYLGRMGENGKIQERHPTY